MMTAGTTNSVTATSVMYSCHCHGSEKSIQHCRRPEGRARRLQHLQRSYKTELHYLSFQIEIEIELFLFLYLCWVMYVWLLSIKQETNQFMAKQQAKMEVWENGHVEQFFN
jgi:hypothetical protein